MAKKQTKKVVKKPLGDPQPLPTCPKGKIWNPVLGKCVDELG